MAELIAYLGTMDSGKSALALQLDSAMRSRSLVGRYYARMPGIITAPGDPSTITAAKVMATEVGPALDLLADARANEPLDYVIANEVHFYAPTQIEQLAAIVDILGADVFSFGVLTDFKGKLFPGSKRLLELADRRLDLPVPALCWCGRRATHNARIIDGQVVGAGRLLDVGAAYQTVCRRHYLDGTIIPSPRQRRRPRKPRPAR